MALMIGITTPTFADSENPLCAAKEADIRQQMDAAREHGNANRLRGLETALENIRTDCSDDDLMADARQDVRDSMEEVRERQQDLEDAIEDGDTGKIEKRRDKLKEATDELDEHTQTFEMLQSSR